LQFLGATGTVTGSRFLLDTPQARLLVDCGLFQGLKALRLRNWSAFPIPPSTIDAVVLTHAHVDHSGYLPRLVRDGFRGPIYATRGTHALCQIVLPDSAHLQEEDASYANRKGFSKHTPALPLYTEEDALRALANFREVPFHASTEVARGVHATFRPAGHILGSSAVELALAGPPSRRVLVSGDLGRPNHPILRPPEPPVAVDALLIESTYGDRRHPSDDADAAFEVAIARTAARKGTVVIPAFAVDRTEVILVTLRRLMREGRVPELPVYVDSPMALSALALYRTALKHGAPDVRSDFCGDGDPFDTGHLVETRSIEQSKAIDGQKPPFIIISASGMATGGRVLHHLAHFLPDSRNTVLLPGFQAEGTRGRSLLEGASALKIHGRYVPVRAEVVGLSHFSVHADQEELVAWLRSIAREPDATFIVHGEAPASAALRERIRRDLGWTAVVPGDLERVRLG
jgi:metallo-beta-lactamase family protein